MADIDERTALKRYLDGRRIPYEERGASIRIRVAIGGPKAHATVVVAFRDDGSEDRVLVWKFVRFRDTRKNHVTLLKASGIQFSPEPHFAFTSAVSLFRGCTTDRMPGYVPEEVAA